MRGWNTFESICFKVFLLIAILFTPALSHEEEKQCKKDDVLLERFTSLRIALMGLLLLFRTYTILNKTSELSEKKDKSSRPHPFKDHPNLTDRMIDAENNSLVRFFFAGIIFIQSEGVGLVVYFMTSAALDNYTIYLVDNVRYCEYVMQAALYSMSLLTFLPTVVIAFCLQGKWYDNGSWTCWNADSDKLAGGKVYFLLLMFCGTVLSFFVRLQLVYHWGWDDFVNKLMHEQLASSKVIVAIAVPPIVDALQTLMLIFAAIFSGKKADDSDVAE